MNNSQSTSNLKSFNNSNFRSSSNFNSSYNNTNLKNNFTTNSKSRSYSTNNVLRTTTAGLTKQSDNRPLLDKNFQISCSTKVFNFLVNNSYSNVAHSNSKWLLTLGKSEYIKIFLFILSYIRPDVDIKINKIEEELPKIVNELSYPGSLSKHTLMAIGAPNSNGQLIALLVWMVELAEYLMDCEEKEHQENEIINLLIKNKCYNLIEGNSLISNVSLNVDSNLNNIINSSINSINNKDKEIINKKLKNLSILNEITEDDREINSNTKDNIKSSNKKYNFDNNKQDISNNNNQNIIEFINEKKDDIKIKVENEFLYNATKEFYNKNTIEESYNVYKEHLYKDINAKKESIKIIESKIITEKENVKEYNNYLEEFVSLYAKIEKNKNDIIIIDKKLQNIDVQISINSVDIKSIENDLNILESKKVNLEEEETRLQVVIDKQEMTKEIYERKKHIIEDNYNKIKEKIIIVNDLIKNVLYCKLTNTNIVGKVEDIDKIIEEICPVFEDLQLKIDSNEIIYENNNILNTESNNNNSLKKDSILFRSKNNIEINKNNINNNKTESSIIEDNFIQELKKFKYEIELNIADFSILIDSINSYSKYIDNVTNNSNSTNSSLNNSKGKDNDNHIKKLIKFNKLIKEEEIESLAKTCLSLLGSYIEFFENFDKKAENWIADIIYSACELEKINAKVTNNINNNNQNIKIIEKEIEESNNLISELNHENNQIEFQINKTNELIIEEDNVFNNSLNKFNLKQNELIVNKNDLELENQKLCLKIEENEAYILSLDNEIKIKEKLAIEEIKESDNILNNLMIQAQEYKSKIHKRLKRHLIKCKKAYDDFEVYINKDLEEAKEQLCIIDDEQ